jgi:hypothetical protein
LIAIYYRGPGNYRQLFPCIPAGLRQSPAARSNHRPASARSCAALVPAARSRGSASGQRRPSAAARRQRCSASGSATSSSPPRARVASTSTRDATVSAGRRSVVSAIGATGRCRERLRAGTTTSRGPSETPRESAAQWSVVMWPRQPLEVR